MADVPKPDDGSAFLALPRELRDKIYGMVMSEDDTLEFINGCMPGSAQGKLSSYDFQTFLTHSQ